MSSQHSISNECVTSVSFEADNLYRYDEVVRQEPIEVSRGLGRPKRLDVSREKSRSQDVFYKFIARRQLAYWAQKYPER